MIASGYLLKRPRSEAEALADIERNQAQRGTVATGCITGHLTGTQDAGRGILSSEPGPRPEATGETRVGSPQFHPAPLSPQGNDSPAIQGDGMSVDFEATDTTADRLRDFCDAASIRCPASTTGRRCSHSECAMYGCPYAARAA